MCCKRDNRNTSARRSKLEVNVCDRIIICNIHLWIIINSSPSPVPAASPNQNMKNESPRQELLGWTKRTNTSDSQLPTSTNSKSVTQNGFARRYRQTESSSLAHTPRVGIFSTGRTSCLEGKLLELYLTDTLPDTRA